MTDAPSTTPESSAPGNKGVKRGLPLVGLPDASVAAEALWEVARLGLAANRAFADKIGRKTASGGAWDRLVAVLRGFGLIRLEGEQIGLSALGQQVVNGSDPAQQMAARRTALLHLKAYRELVEDFDGTPVPEQSTLASRLRFEYGKKEDFADKAAKAFLESLAFAEMVDAAHFVRRSGADAPMEEPVPDDEDEQADFIDDAFDGEDEGEDESSAPEGGESAEGRGDVVLESLSTTGSARVRISVSLDLSGFRADEVIDILRALKS